MKIPRALLFNIPLLIAALALVACSNGRTGGRSSRVNTSSPVATTSPVNQPSQGMSGEGGWESSGGDGVACFATVATATLAQQELKTQGYLSSSIRAAIQSVSTLDGWDNITTEDEFAKKGMIVFPWVRYEQNISMLVSPDLLALKSESEITARIIQSLALHVPLFAERIEVIRQRFPVVSWAGALQIEQLDDSKPRRAISDKCVLIQLARRQSLSTEGKVPQIKMVYDQELYDKFLSPVERSMLVLHEYLYLIARETGHVDSDVIRPFNAFLFALDHPVNERTNPAMAGIMRQFVGRPFGDYMRFFLAEADLKPTETSPGTQESRYHSLISLMTKMRADMALCRREGRTQIECQQKTVEGDSAFKNTLTTEEAFLFIGRFYLDGEMTKHNSEMLSARSLKISATEPSALNSQISDYCSFMQEKPSLQYFLIQDLALAYCRDQLAQPVSPFSSRPLEHKSNCVMKDGELPIFSVTGSREAGLALVMTDKAAGGTPLLSRVEVPAVLKVSTLTSEVFEFGAGDRQYSAIEEYEFKMGADSDAFAIQKLAQLKPDAISSVSIVEFLSDGSSRQITLTGAKAVSYLAGDRTGLGQVATIGATLKFARCETLDTHLPFAPDDFALLLERGRRERFVVPTAD